MKLLNTTPPGGVRVSPTQIKLWKACPRAWGWRYLAGIKSPQSPAQALGSRCHAVAEAWLRDGTPPDMDEVFPTDKGPRYPGRIFEPGMVLLPAPRQLLVEEKFCIEVEPDLYLFGFIDLLTAEWVIDHKFVGSFRYVPSPDDLAKDEQAIIYAKVGCLLDCKIMASWHYYRTTGTSAARVVSAAMPESYVDLALEKHIIPTMHAIAEARRTKPDPLDMEPNPAHCGAYTGCPHAERCNISPQARFRTAMAKVNLKDFIAERQAQMADGAEAPPPPVEEAPPPPVEEAPPPPVEEAPSPPAEDTTPDLATLSRPALKALAVSLGLIGEGKQEGGAMRESGLRKVLEEHYAPTPPDAPQAPEPPPLGEMVISTGAPDGLPHDIGTLYVDCVPYQEDYTLLSTLIATALDALDYEVDYRLVPDSSYGKAGAVLCDAVMQALADLGGPVDVVASTRSTEHRDCLARLEGVAGHVVKGV